MAVQSFTIKAVSDAALMQLLLSNGLLILGEGPPRNAEGVLQSNIGDAVLEGTNIKLAGRFAFIGIDDAKFGVGSTQAVMAALADSTVNPSPRAILGIAPTDPFADRPADALGAAKWSAIKAINEECKRRIVAVWPIEKQNTAIIGKLGSVAGYGDAGFDEMETWVDSHVAASNVAQDAILAIQPGPNAVVQVEAVTVTWPAI